MEYAVIVLFSLTLFLTIVLHMPLLLALVLGYIYFWLYGLHKGCSAKALFVQSLEQCKKIGNLLTLFALIGVLTATWRASGTIAFLVVNSAYILIPSLFLVSTFLLCACISMLTGTSFGTSATMGVICMTMGNVLGIDSAYLGGAILSGSYFGDRMSPMSSSAHLVAKITETDIFINIKNMFYSCLGPFLLSCGFYVFLGQESKGAEIPLETLQLFQENFNLAWPTVLPALLMVMLACCKVHARIIMLASIVAASILCIFWQNISWNQLLTLYWGGFVAPQPALQAVLGGGGLMSMFTVACIVAISSAYMGLFHESQFFNNIHKQIAHLSQKTGAFGSTALVALFACMLTCNQTLSIFLTKTLCEKQYEQRESLALAIENSAVLMAGLVPWSIACSVVLANVHAPVSSIFFACFLYIVPLSSVLFFKRKAFV